MDKPRRDNLRTVIHRVRGTIEGSLERQLVAYGFFRDTAPMSRDELRLGPDQEALYPRLEDAVLRHGRAVAKEGILTPEAVDRFIREAGGTWVNRLAALRALEERGFLNPRAAFVSDEYGGISPRARDLREQAAGDGKSLSSNEAMRAAIEDACRKLSESVRVLFDLGDEQSLIWPDNATLREALRLLSREVTPADWAEPEVLGWVYQYYNTEANAALKKLKNSTVGYKYKADDIPIANQFYTPHWVVRFLTDNTLGRLWLEAQERLPRLETEPYHLTERRQGVPHAAEEPEAFKAWLCEEPDPLRDGVDRLCRFLVPLPSHAVPRAKKSVREIRVLDPACGSGHFLLYAFDLLFSMYRESEPGLDPREIPGLILERNLFGIDIDLRAAQLAAFNLYLKARATLSAVDPDAKLTIRGLNIVVADAHIDGDPQKAEFLDRYKGDPEVRQLYGKVLSDLDNTNVLGSLLKVRTEFEILFGRVREAKRREKQEGDAFSMSGQEALFDVSRQRDLLETFRGFSGRTWTIADLLGDLRRFEREVRPTQDVGAGLFYTDLERSVGLLALLSQQYDVVLMNPPYGDMPQDSKDYFAGNKKKGIPAHYPRTHSAYDAAFMEQGLDLLVANGLLGALVPRSFMYLSTLEKVRNEILFAEARPELLQEYALGILDGATVRTVASVIRKGHFAEANAEHLAVFHRLSYYPTEVKLQQFLKTLPLFAASGPDPEVDWFVASLRSLRDVPRMPYAYWASESLRALFRRFPPLDVHQKGALVPGRPKSKIADVKQGLATADDPRFVRFWWEARVKEVGRGKRWVWLSKGGGRVCFYTRADFVLDWKDDGREIREFRMARPQNLDFNFRGGLCWQAVGWGWRRFGLLSEEFAFTNRGPMVFPRRHTAVLLMGLLNSKLLAALELGINVEREWHIGYVSPLPIAEEADPRIKTLAQALHDLRRTLEVGDETCRDFACPALRSSWQKAAPAGPGFSLSRVLDCWLHDRQRTASQEAELLERLDTHVFEAYAIRREDRVLIERELARRPRSESGYSGEELDRSAADRAIADDGAASANEESQEEGVEIAGGEAIDTLSPLQARDQIARWLSYYLKQVFESDEHGIVPVGATRTVPGLVVRLREAMEKDIGKNVAGELLSQAPGYLGTDSAAEWLAVSREATIETGGKKRKLPVGFFPWHVHLYRNRPIFWLLSSEGFAKGKTRLTFQAYVHYLKLTPDTLPRLVSHYLESALDQAQEEWNDAKARAQSLDGRAKRAAQNEAQEWLNTVDALKRFKIAVEQVIQGRTTIERVPATAKWLPRTIAHVRGGRDVGHGYQPNVDYGVRVNIAPLVEERLLPKVVLKKLGG